MFSFRHSGIFGKTQMGKSRLLKIFAQDFTEQGREVLVYDLTMSDDAVKEANEGSKEEWNAAFVTNNEEMFLALFWEGHDLIVLVDEGNESAGRGNDGLRFATTRGSHQRGALGAGNSIFYAAHRYHGLDKTIRGQLSDFFIFNTSKEDAVDLANEFDEPRLRMATKLPVGEFYYIGSGKAFEHWRIDFENNTLEKVEDAPNP
jgi:DNA helicase HerA-like ATPase